MDHRVEKTLLHDRLLDHRTVLHIGTGEMKGQNKNLAMVGDSKIRKPRVLTMLFLWYFFSGVTLFLNKFVLTAMNNGAGSLGLIQVLVTTICGFIQLYYPCGMWIATKQNTKPPKFKRLMVLVGIFRFLTIWFGLVALDFVAVSFAETVKCSAPIFTVIISRFITGEPATLPIVLSLVPVMTGLALCSAHELSFNLPGFIAALVTNVSECFQSVYSKLLVSGDKFHCNPAELQFYSGAASLIFIIPTVCFFQWDNLFPSVDGILACWLLLNGLSFHFQSITANVLMGFLSPTTYSVSNTVKRALLIWCSILIFGNPVTVGAWIGTGLMLIGILLYNKAKTAVIVEVLTSD